MQKVSQFININTKQADLKIMGPAIILYIKIWLFFSDALQIISTAGTHANNAIAKIERFKQLLEITKKLGGQIDLVHPVRKLLKEGDLKKITTSDKGDVEQHVRHMYLVRGYLVRLMVLTNDITLIRSVLHGNFISLITLLVQ